MKQFKLLILMLAFCGMIPLSAYAAVEGYFGTDNKLRWSYGERENKLLVTGSGAIPNYSNSSETPWADYRSSITSIEIGSNVTGIGNYAFSYCTNVTSVTIPDGVTNIAMYAFQGCPNLTSINIPDGVTSIGYATFQDCSSLTSINIPDGVTFIENGAFDNCTGLTAVYISDLASWCAINFAGFLSNPLYYAHTLYLNNTPVTELTIPNSFTSIGNYAFCGCSSMTSVTIPNSVRSIGTGAFQGCTGLTSITNNATTPQTIDANVFDGLTLSSITLNVPEASVEVYAAADVWKDFMIVVKTWTSGTTTCSLYADGSFVVAPTDGLSGAMADYSINTDDPWKDYVADIKTVEIQSGVTSIGTNAFNGCTKLTSVTIPNSVTRIGDFVFFQCYTLVSVEIPNSVTSIGADAFYQCSSLTSVTIPNSVTQIGLSTFYGCTKLTSVTIPNSVTSIGMQAFKGCTKLSSVTIPNSVTSIGQNAFNGCTNLTSVTNNATTPQSIKTNVFDGLTLSNITLFVPEASVEAYATADVWKDFKIVVKRWTSGSTTCTLYADGSFVVAPIDGDASQQDAE
ncbi:MAG: leucine-rich repeat domain-containing protein [Paludibacteraceae bacterium]|nr:leucine-rich repeat domain-containing protein [Paludibacteraceae bacterium]